jgi:predicted TIM-barrel fold metal-dependent hydrolase
MRTAILTRLVLTGCCFVVPPALAQDLASAGSKQAAQWRSEHRLIDMHQHIGMAPQYVDRAVKIMDAAGIGIAVNLGAGTVTRGKNGEPSAFEQGKQLTDARHPGRFLHYMVLDFRGWDAPDFSQRAVKQIDQGRRLGSAGLKEFKRLGLYLRDGAGKLIPVDDPKLDPVWKRCGELDMPVSIHVADPKAFWLPLDRSNERWKELGDHREWWFGDGKKFPGWKELLDALDRVVARHRKTTFVCVHFGNNAEELDWVEQALDRNPNMMVDLAARIPEIGRHDPDRVRRLFLKHQDRILFGSDFQVYDRLIPGSSGNEPPPSDRDAEVFFAKHGRWLETRDRDWPHMTPIQGDWTIRSIGLPETVLRKIYFDNARKLLARSLPAPVMKAARIDDDFAPDGDTSKPAWREATPVRLEYTLREGDPRPELSTAVRCLWSKRYLYFSYECPYTELTLFTPPSPPGRERLGLWDRDVVEAFIGADAKNPQRYAEFEIAPTNERLDVAVDLPQKDFAWSGRFESAVKIHEQAKVWTVEMRIPLDALCPTAPQPGVRWRLNLFRSDRAAKAFLAWNPALTPSTHTPERFGILEFAP